MNKSCSEKLIHSTDSNNLSNLTRSLCKKKLEATLLFANFSICIIFPLSMESNLHTQREDDTNTFSRWSPQRKTVTSYNDAL